MKNLGDWSQWISALGYQPYTVHSRDDFVYGSTVSVMRRHAATMQHTTSTMGVTVTIDPRWNQTRHKGSDHNWRASRLFRESIDEDCSRV